MAVLMSGKSREMFDDELVQGSFPGMDVAALTGVTMVHDAGDEVWVAGHGGSTAQGTSKADALEALASKLREQEE